MKRKTLTVTVSRTRQVRQYEPLTITLSEVLELETSDDPKEVRKKSSASLVTSVEEALDKALKKLAD